MSSDDRQRIAQGLAKLSEAQKPKEGLSLAEQCMRNIERLTAGGKMSPAQRHVYDSCARMLNRGQEVQP